MSTSYISGTVLDTRDTVVSKIDTDPELMNLLMMETDINPATK